MSSNRTFAGVMDEVRAYLAEITLEGGVKLSGEVIDAIVAWLTAQAGGVLDSFARLSYERMKTECAARRWDLTEAVQRTTLDKCRGHKRERKTTSSSSAAAPRTSFQLQALTTRQLVEKLAEDPLNLQSVYMRRLRTILREVGCADADCVIWTEDFTAVDVDLTCQVVEGIVRTRQRSKRLVFGRPVMALGQAPNEMVETDPWDSASEISIDGKAGGIDYTGVSEEMKSFLRFLSLRKPGTRPTDMQRSLLVSHVRGSDLEAVALLFAGEDAEGVVFDFKEQLRSGQAPITKVPRSVFEAGKTGAASGRRSNSLETAVSGRRLVAH